MSVDASERRAREDWIDISVAVSPTDTPTWPGSPRVRFERRLSLARGDAAEDSTVTFSVHTGTHVDAPAHVVRGGRTIDGLPLPVFVGRCTVVDLRGLAVIDRRDLEARAGEIGSRTLFRTDNSDLWSSEFRSDFVGLTAAAARWLAAREVRLVGIDYLSVQPWEGDDEVHRALLEAGVALLEGLDLSDVRPGGYELMCLPIRLAGLEAAPARALLRPIPDERTKVEGTP